ncbi:MAG: branched-chain amino acid ABC transporter permease [Candidatus Bipolaricaulota bacterium]|nr:branched-chain amino acid ABC transporter permease [Candidatus Bipolaricaulota bacterium]MBS3792291.1 branched-chain amino acid ABC transporter permease [Candidatus Bipolaricaulota bacterium]
MQTEASWNLGKLLTVLVVVLTGFGVLPLFLGRFQVVLVTEALILGVYALSFDLIFGYAGMLSFGQSIFFGVGAYTILYSFKGGLGLAVSLLLAVFVAGIFGLLVGSAIVRIKGAKFFLVTLVGSILFYLLALDNRWLTGGSDGMVVPTVFPGLVENYYLVLGVSLTTILFALILVKSPLGLVLKMIRDNERRAGLLGYSLKKYKVMTFTIGGGIAGLAGGLYAYTSGFVSAGFFHWTRSADAVVWTILGGAGTVVGPFVGAALLTVVRDTLSAVMGNIYPVVVGALLVLAVVVFPRGVFGLLERAVGNWKGGSGG